MVDSIWMRNSGLYLGFPRLPGERVQLRRELAYTGDRHAISYGPNGSGKTKRLALINACRLREWTIILIDTKGVLCAMTHALRASQGCKNYIFNPGDMLGLGTDTHNPVAALDPSSKHFVDDVNEHAETIIPVDNKTHEKHWPEAGQELFGGVEMYVSAILNGSMADVRALLGQSATDFRRMIKFTPFTYQGVDYPCVRDAAEMLNLPAMYYKLAQFEDMQPDDRELKSIFTTTKTQTKSFDSDPIKNALSGKAVDFSKLKEEPSTVYLIVPPSRLETYAKWLRLMIASILRNLLRDVRPAKVPVMFIFDEAFALLQGGFKIVETLFAQVREFGVKFWFLFQDLAQMIMLYGQPDFETYIANAGVIQAFAPQDNVTADWISQRTGHDTKYALSVNGSRSWGSRDVSISTSSGVSQIDRALMLPQELREMPDGDTVVFSHQWKGTVLSHLPWPGDLPWMRDIMKLTP